MADAHSDSASADDAKVQDLASLYAGMTPNVVRAGRGAGLMGLDVRIVAFRRHLPPLTDINVANLRQRLNATPARPFATGMALDDSWYKWPEKYQAQGEDAPAAHAQAIYVESGMRYFGPGYHRGDWPAFKAIILWLHEHVSPDVWYGIDDVGCDGSPADDDLIAEHDAAWEACGEESWYGRDDEDPAATFTAEWNAVRAASLTPDQERAVNRGAHLTVFGTEPPAGKPIDFRKAIPGKIFTL